jgi:hypothetical protein
VARTLLDLAWSGVGRQGLEKAVDRAELLGTFDATALDDVLIRAGPRRGAAVLRSIAGAIRPLLRSNPERDFHTECRALGVPEPLVNHWMPLGEEWIEVDFIWPDARLIVEVDGGAVHGTTRARRRDRRRDAQLTLAGWTVIRFSDDDLLNDVAYVRRTLLSALSRPAATGR